MVGDSAARPPETAFQIVRKGYDQAQVVAHLRRLDADIQILTTDRNAATDQSAQLARELGEARDLTERLRAQVRSLVTPPQNVQGMSERMRSMLRLAEDEVTEMLAQAEAEAGRRLREADKQAAQILDAARAETVTVHADANSEARRREQDVAQGYARLETERRAAAADLINAAEQARQERAAAAAESEARRALVEEDFYLAMDQRRSEALRSLAAEQQQTRRDAEAQRERAAAAARSMIDDARAQAQAIVGDAHRGLVELTTLRGLVVEQLDGARAALDGALGNLTPPPEEAPQPPARPADQRRPTPFARTAEGGPPERPSTGRNPTTAGARH